MTDIALEWDSIAGAADVVIENNDLKADDGLRTALYLSLFTDRRAEPGDVLPDGETDRRGWWADAVPVTPGDLMGSRLWLLARSKREPATLDRAVTYAREALQWLVDDRVCDSFNVTAEYLSPYNGFAIVVSVPRPVGSPTLYRFDHTWTAEAAR